MSTERHARLFRNGRNQALRIPRDLELPGREAILRKDGPRLVLEPVAGPLPPSLPAKLNPLDEAFPPVDRLPVILENLNRTTWRCAESVGRRKRLKSSDGSAA